MDDFSDALAIINKWDWPERDPRFDEYVRYTIAVSEAINRLAMEGHPNPADAVLSLLADGRLVATGRYRWKQYRNDHFYRDDVGTISSVRWAALKAAIAERDYLSSRPEVTLHMLSEDESGHAEPCAEWNWGGNWFSTARKSGGDWLSPDYIEEVFSASDIEVRPADIKAVKTTAELDNQAERNPNRGGAPPKYDWERAVAAIVFQWAEEGSWQPEIQADVKKRLADWFAEQDLHPSDSMLKERARWLFAEFQRRNGKADNLAA